MNLNVFERWRDWADNRGISKQTPDRNGYIANKVEELGEYAEAMKKNDENEAIDAIADSMTFDATELVKMGYDIERVIAEVLLVIESRTGKWDELNNKFQKDMSAEAVAKWYIPDYVKNCKAKTNYTGSLFAHKDNGCDSEEHN